MMLKTFNNIHRQIILISAFLVFVSCAYPYSNWETYKEDDGSMDSNWGFSGDPSDVLCKTFVLDKADGTKDAMIRYEMGSDPYHYQTKTCYSEPKEGVQWNDMVIMVNDAVVAKESPVKLGTKGWHRVQFDAKLLKQGENTIKFTWAGGTKEGAGGFYMGIDTATKKGCSSASCTGGTTFQKECLRMGMGLGGPIDPKWQGEYMVRLFVAFSKRGGEAQSVGNTAATGNVEEARSSVEKTGNPVREFKSFEDWPAGAITATNCIVKCGEKSSVKIADVPTWLYYNVKDKFRSYQENEDPAKADEMMKGATNKGARFISDHCVALVSEDDKQKAVISFPAPAMKAGLVEFDVMAESCTGDALRVRLGENLGLMIDKEGAFYWEAGDKKIKLADKISYHSLPAAGRFCFWPQRWYTVRIDFDASLSLANVAIVNMYNSYNQGVPQFFLIGEDLPLPADTVANITFETAGAGRFYIDNLFFVNRTTDLADDAKWRVAAREIMKVYYHLRKDLLSMKMSSLRNVRQMFGSGHPSGDELQDLTGSPEKYQVVLECARQYNQLLIAQAFLAEKLRGLERAYFYLNIKSVELSGKYNEQIIQVRKSVAETEVLLAQLYRFYADCYLDNLNQAKMSEGFTSRQEAVKTASDRSNSAIQAIYKTMCIETSSKEGDIACRYEQAPVADRLEFRDGSHRSGGKRDYVFAGSRLLWPSMEEDLLLQKICMMGADWVSRNVHEPNYCDSSTNTYLYQSMKTRETDRFILQTFYGLLEQGSVLPAWWSDKHKDDPDIYLRNCKGEVTLSDDPTAWRPFNYWHPEVLKAHEAYLKEIINVVAGYNKDWLKRMVYFYMAQEMRTQIPAPGGLWQVGYNKTAVKAFREQLKKENGSIGVLNERWGSKYGNFDEIQPPEDVLLKPRLAPTALAYEFERFRQKSWFDWMKQCGNWVKGQFPDNNMPIACCPSYPILGCADSIDGWDSVKLFETFEIVMDHYQFRFVEDPSVYRYLENLRQIFHTSTGIPWGTVGSDQIFDEQSVLNGSLRSVYQNIQWGRNVLEYRPGHDTIYTENEFWTEGRLGHTVLRYHATYIPLGIARARAHQAIYLECPLVEPDVGIVESETSFYNSTGMRGGMGEFAGVLSSRGHDFGYLFERLIMDGRQKLDNYKVLILPNALALPADFTQKILAWVEKGGVLVTKGPAGIWNEYGQTNGLIIDKIIGKGNWTCEGRAFKLKDKMPDAETCKVVYRKDSSFLVEGKLGKGKVYMCQGSVPEDMVYALVGTNAPRLFYGEDKKFHLVMREDAKGVAGKAGALYLSLLNPDCYQTLEDEIAVKGEYKDVTDISCNFPMAVTIKDGYARFKVRLAPAEGVMIRIQK